MPAIIPAVIGAAGAIGGGLLSKQKQQQQQQYNNTTTSMPQTDPSFLPLRNILLQQAQRRISQGGLPAGTVEGGIENINQNTRLGDEALNNTLAARGLSNSPIAGQAAIQSELARRGTLNTFRNIQVPQLKNQFQLQNLDLGKSILPFGTGTTTTGSGTSSGTSVGSVNPAGAAISSGAEMLALLYGMGAFNKGNAGNTTKAAPAGSTGIDYGALLNFPLYTGALGGF